MAVKTFDEVVLFARTGLNPRTNFKLGNGTNKYITIKNIHNNELIIDENTDVVDDDAIELIHKRSQIKKGDILFCSIGRMGDMFIIPEEPVGWDINESVFAFTVNTDIVRQKYFYYVFKNHDTIEYLSKNSSGSTFKSIKMNQLKKMIFDLPTLNEQDRIVDILDRLSQIIKNREAELAKLDELIKARFVEMFGEGLKDDGKFEVRFISEIGKVVSGATPKTAVEEYWDGANLWITPAELSNESFILYDSERKITDRGVKSCAVNLLPIGTVILSSRAPIGKVAIAGTEMYCNQGFKNIIPNDMINSIYLYELLKMETAYLNSLGRGATFKEISKQIVENIRVKVPPIELQKQFAEFVKQVDKSKVVALKAA
ncbi:MAG: restriction endonuclease subunit S [Lachnospiraceae bacterium]|nr:restriction endonuclease subunit S [Lachnospiraceae bacterium]